MHRTEASAGGVVSPETPLGPEPLTWIAERGRHGV